MERKGSRVLNLLSGRMESLTEAQPRSLLHVLRAVQLVAGAVHRPKYLEKFIHCSRGSVVYLWASAVGAHS